MLTAEQVLNARFAATKFRVGYDQSAVDDFLDRVVLTLRAIEQGTVADGALDLDALDATAFPVTKFREGYDQEAVDELLAAVRETLATPRTPSRVPVAEPTVEDRPAEIPGLIAPASGWRRLFGR